MAYKFQGHKTFEVGEHYVFECKAQRTSYGFRHLVDLRRDGYIVSSAKCCYYNRTWEKYEYQSVMEEAIRKADTLTQAEKDFLNEWAKDGKEQIKQEMSGLGAAAMVAKLGDIICETKAEKNAWKKRMLNTVNGIIFPDDFDTLSEDEKECRLDGAINLV